jgi:hypothetical protein
MSWFCTICPLTSCCAGIQMIHEIQAQEGVIFGFMPDSVTKVTNTPQKMVR